MTKRASFTWNPMDGQYRWIEIVKYIEKSFTSFGQFERFINTTVMAFEVKWPKSHLDWNQSKSELHLVFFFGLCCSSIFKVKIYGSHKFGIDVYLHHFSPHLNFGLSIVCK